MPRGRGATQAEVPRGHGMDKDAQARGELQAALGLLRAGSSLRKVSKMRDTFGQVFPNCQGLDPESPWRVPFTTPPSQRASAPAWQSQSCLGLCAGRTQSPCLPVLSGP